jgi:hypothetical protein
VGKGKQAVEYRAINASHQSRRLNANQRRKARIRNIRANPRHDVGCESGAYQRMPLIVASIVRADNSRRKGLQELPFLVRHGVVERHCKTLDERRRSGRRVRMLFAREQRDERHDAEPACLAIASATNQHDVSVSPLKGSNSGKPLAGSQNSWRGYRGIDVI